MPGAEPAGAPPARRKEGATVRVAYLYPPSRTFAENPAGWWSWPGNEFDAEARQKAHTAALRGMEKKLGMKLEVGERPVAAWADAQRLARKLAGRKPDGLLLIMFHNRSLAHADLLLKAAEAARVPVIFYIGLGVKHGPVTAYRRPGVYFIQSLENLEAIESGLRMINARKLMAQARLLSVTDDRPPGDTVEPFFGTRVTVIPFARYAEEFGRVVLGRDSQEFIARFTGRATAQRGVTGEALENAARAHLALKKLLAEEAADGVAMNCLVKGHHNLLFAGDHARTFRLFARLHQLKLADTGYRGI